MLVPVLVPGPARVQAVIVLENTETIKRFDKHHFSVKALCLKDALAEMWK